MEKYAGQISNYPYTITIKRSWKKGEEGQKCLYCEDILTFDIECTSFFFDTDKKPFLYKPGEDPDYWCGTGVGSLPYIWQFGINNKYYYGRELKDFTKVLDDIPKDLHCRIHVHNLSYEWNHLDFLTWVKVFAKSPHKPITAICAEYPNIEFRCTLALENRSLESWGKSVGLPKLVGSLDYNQMRTPLTPLTDEEMAYAQRDLEVMYLGLQKELKFYGSIWKLPMTATGKVRKEAKELLWKIPDYGKKIKKLIPDVYQYKTSMDSLAGGYCHGNRLYTGITVYNKDGLHGDHGDFCSSYPTQMILGKVPVSPFYWYGQKLPDDDRMEDYAYKMKVTFKKIESELQNTYIQYSHTSCIGAEVDNGRLICAESCTMWLTEWDLMIIKKAYTWQDIEVIECWEATKGYLPKEYQEYVLDLFEGKTKWKHVDDDECQRQKAFLNSLFGMSITSLIMGDVVWDPEAEEWSTKRLTQQKIEEHLEKLKAYRERRYFLNYDWGCAIANGSRARLWLDFIIPYDKHILYADTDSIFTNIKMNFTEYNKKVDEKMKAVCEERGLDFAKTRPKNSKGEQSFLGHMTHEPEWTEFRHLGAKRYVERWKEDGKLHLTLSGVPKSAVTVLKDDIENFRDGIIFDKDDPDVNKLMHTYYDHLPDLTFPDGYVSHQRRGVNLRPNGYKLTMEKDPYMDMEKGMVNEAYENHMRGVWYDDVEDIVAFYQERSYLK